MSNATGEHVTRTQTAAETLLYLYCKCKQDVSITDLEVIKLEYSLKLKISTMSGCLRTRRVNYRPRGYKT